MCNSVNNTYKKHLPVYIYIHSSLIEPVGITALQIIIIIDPCEIHRPRLNILIYVQFKKNQRMDTSIQGTQALVRNMFIYYMANPVLGKSLCSDWFFLGQDFAVRTVSMETVQFVYFCFGAKPANSKFTTKTAKKRGENCHSSH